MHVRIRHRAPPEVRRHPPFDRLVEMPKLRIRSVRAAARIPTIAGVLLIAATTVLEAQTLRGSRAAVDRMYRQAHADGLHFYQTADGVNRAVQRGTLVTLRTGPDYVVHNVRYPHVRPEALVFVERLASQYRSACGERLVVTSAIRPQYYQRRLVNGSDRSVHPTGMAIDLRRPNNPRCLRWLRSTLLSLDRSGVIEAIEEQRPPHFHVAVFISPYRNYVNALTSGGATRTASATSTPAPARASSTTPAARPAGSYVVRRGDNLWGIARREGTTVTALRSANNLRSDRLQPGQRLTIPGRAGGAAAAAPSTSVSDVTYRVRRGDTLWSIARNHSSSVEDIKRANSITSTRLMPGQELTIPAR
jgi:LysM repeat protein